jgi:hypothetical protein
MKKTILILSIASVIGFTGCSKAEIEKRPISIEDAASLEEEITSDTAKDVPTNEEITKIPEVIDSGEEPKEETNEDMKEEAKGEVKLKEGDKPTPVTIEIEGMKETMYGLWHDGDGYDIMYDVDRFEYSDKDGVDTFIAENPDPAIYPYVYVSINHLENRRASDHAKELLEMLSKNSLISETTKDVSIGNYKGTLITAKAGSQWNSIVRNYYIITDNTSIYTIETQYFLEATEGYGARIQAMLDTFKIK